MTQTSKGKALVTGAASALGAAYADRLARRGHDLILVARNRGNLDGIARRIRQECRQDVEVVAADLNDGADLRRIETLLRTDSRITALVNGAGAAAAGSLLLSDIGRRDAMIALNVIALTRLAHAALPGLVARGGGTVINISSIPGTMPDVLEGVYGGTRAFVLAFSLSLQQVFSRDNIRIQAVLPSCADSLPSAMPADDLVDAALAGLDRGEAFTTPSLPGVVDLQAYARARRHTQRPLRPRTGKRRFADEKGIDGAVEGF